VPAQDLSPDIPALVLRPLGLHVCTYFVTDMRILAPTPFCLSFISDMICSSDTSNPFLTPESMKMLLRQFTEPLIRIFPFLSFIASPDFHSYC